MYKLIKIIIKIGDKEYYPLKNGEIYMINIIEDINKIPPIKSSELNKVISRLEKVDYSLRIVAA